MPKSSKEFFTAIGESAKSNPVTTVFLAFWVLLAVASLLWPHLPSPAAWLDAWTKWIATAVGVVVSARVLWSGAAALQRYANKP